MLVMVLVLGATMLGASVIAGYITVQELRTAGDITHSAQAIYAADSGMGWELYKTFVGDNGLSYPTFSNGATVSTTEETAEDYSSVTLKSFGNAGRVHRALGFFLGTSSQ